MGFLAKVKKIQIKADMPSSLDVEEYVEFWKKDGKIYASVGHADAGDIDVTKLFKDVDTSWLDAYTEDKNALEVTVKVELELDESAMPMDSFLEYTDSHNRTKKVDVD